MKVYFIEMGEVACAIEPADVRIKLGLTMTLQNNTGVTVEFTFEAGFFDPLKSFPNPLTLMDGRQRVTLNPSESLLLVTLSDAEPGECGYWLSCCPDGGGAPKSIRVEPPGYSG